MDLWSDLRMGFLKAIQLCLKLKPGGLATAGPPCGSFVFLNRWTSKRSATRPFGCKLPYVQDANETLWCMHACISHTIKHDLINQDTEVQCTSYVMVRCLENKPWSLWGGWINWSEDHMQTLPAVDSLLRSLRRVLDRTASFYTDALLSLHQMADPNSSVLLCVVGNTVVGNWDHKGWYQ